MAVVVIMKNKKEYYADSVEVVKVNGLLRLKMFLTGKQIGLGLYEMVEQKGTLLMSDVKTIY